MTSDLHVLSDDQLLLKFRKGELFAYEELYLRYWGLLYLHAYKMLHDEDDAKDVVQEIFVTFYTKIPELEKNALSAYLYTAVRNRILNLIEHHKVKVKYLDSLKLYFEEAHETSSEEFREKELVALIEKEIALLPDKMRKVFEMSRIENLSHKEIASQLHISDKTVKKQISNAIKILKVKLAYFQIFISILLPL
jgi:RNA polymerase sigma-70 factor, ECF subfamily